MKVLLTKSLESVATSLIGEEETSVWFHSKLICASSVHFNILNTITCLGCKLMTTMKVQAVLHSLTGFVLSSVRAQCHISRVHDHLLTWTNVKVMVSILGCGNLKVKRLQSNESSHQLVINTNVSSLAQF